MVVKLFDKETCVKIGNAISGHGAYMLPDEYFGTHHKVIRKYSDAVELKPDESLSMTLRLMGLPEDTGYMIPIAFIESVKEC